jgi:hypothetical protein
MGVHKKTISVAMVEGSAGAEVRFCGTITNTPDAPRALCRKLSRDRQQLHFCYEAGPCGYGVQRQLTRLGHRCDVVAPALIPRKVGDGVKTDRRDAMMLAQTLRAGQLTAVWVPDEVHRAIAVRSSRGDAGSGAVTGPDDARPAQDKPTAAELPPPPWAGLALWTLDQDVSALARRARLCAPGSASGARGDAATDRAGRGVVRPLEGSDPRVGAAMVAGARWCRRSRRCAVCR